MLYIKSITLHHASSLASLFTTSSLTLIRMVVLGLASPSRSTKCAVTRDGKPLPWRIPCEAVRGREKREPARRVRTSPGSRRARERSAP